MYIQSDKMSPAEFIRAILERDAKNIYRSQRLIVSDRIYVSGKDLKAKQRRKGINSRTGRLENSLSNPEYYIQSKDEEFILAGAYPIYIRFLDMKRLGNWKVYNRQVWGILFNNALMDIKAKYGEYIADRVGDSLRAAFEKYNK